ncbi:MAG TPA: Arc family DNA binding domain-containing protein [Candidatus Eisenbacteria bacterium]|nr:Arc family DNA binding domain-containing protein [Candidatus Eisenbacteria bacterium]
MAERKAFPLRLRADLYRALRLWADDDLRSMNAQIEFLIYRALQESGRLRSESKEPPPEETADQSRS